MVKVCFCDACIKWPWFFRSWKSSYTVHIDSQIAGHDESSWNQAEIKDIIALKFGQMINFQFIRFLMKIVNEIYSSLVGCRHGDQWISLVWIFIAAFHLIARIYLAFNRFLVLIWRVKDEIPSSWWNSVEIFSKERVVISVILSHSFKTFPRFRTCDTLLWKRDFPAQWKAWISTIQRLM